MNRIVNTVLLAFAFAALFAAGPLPVAGAEPSDTAPARASKATSSPAKDKPTAAERRAAASEFEREKLDPEAFAEEDTGESSKEKEATKGGTGSIIRAIAGFVVVIGSVLGVHWLLKRWGASRMQGTAGRAGVIDVVATTSLAQGRALHLVRVGEELVLVGATEQSITRIGDFDASAIGSSAGNAGKGEFQAMLAGAMYGQQPGVPSGMGGAASTREPLIRRLLDNLRMTTAR